MRAGSINLYRPSNATLAIAMLATSKDVAQRLGSVPRALPKVRSGDMATGRSVGLGLGSVPRALPKVRSGCALGSTYESSH